MIIDGNKITPDEGKWLYNGEICSDLVYLGKFDCAENWHEIEHADKPDEDNIRE